jgi:hypothetical protein
MVLSLEKIAIAIFSISLNGFTIINRWIKTESHLHSKFKNEKT